MLRESPWYQNIRQGGLREGWYEGWLVGRREEAREGIIRLLKVRFDPDAEMVQVLTEQLQAMTDLLMLRGLLVEAAQVKSLDAFWSLTAAILILTVGCSRIIKHSEVFGISRGQGVGLPNLLGSPRE